MYRSAIAGDQVPDAFNAPDPTTRPMTVWDHKVKTLAGCMAIASRITSMNPDLTNNFKLNSSGHINMTLLGKIVLENK